MSFRGRVADCEQPPRLAFRFYRHREDGRCILQDDDFWLASALTEIGQIEILGCDTSLGGASSVCQNEVSMFYGVEGPERTLGEHQRTR